jgi:uncharacterized protein (DUF2147 family)
MTIKSILSTFLIVLTFSAFATDKWVRTYYNQEKDGKIEIYKVGDKYFGKIVWLKNPTEPGTTTPKLDKNNPDPALAKKPVQGLVILKNFVAKGESELEGGTIYDPKNGKNYSCKITHNGNTLDVRGYIGVPMFGRTTVWTVAE